MTYPVAMIPYVNMAPFQELGPPEGCTFVNCLPSDSIQALKSRQVWAAAVPVGGLAMLEKETEFVGRFGIAVKERSMSVLFFSDCPFERFSPSMTVGLTGESASSVRLLYLLLGYQNGFGAMPCLVPGGARGDGYLVIGDRALRWAQEYERTGAAHGYSHVVDLAAKWNERFQLPFVFARWVVRVDAPPAFKTTVLDWLQRFSREEDRLIRKVTPAVADQLKLGVTYAGQYLRVIRRCLTREDEAGQALFLGELKRHATPTLFPCADTAGIGK